MNVKVSETVKYKLDIMNNLLGEVMNDLKPDLTQATTYETKEDEFRHLLCVLSMSDCIHGVRKLRYVASLTDAEVQEMCAESDITVSTAIQNMKHNMVGEIMSDLLGGLLTPPAADEV